MAVIYVFFVSFTFSVCEKGAKVGRESWLFSKLLESLSSGINTPVLTDSSHSESSHELEDSLVVFSKDIKEFYEENTLLAGEIHKIS